MMAALFVSGIGFLMAGSMPGGSVNAAAARPTTALRNPRLCAYCRPPTAHPGPACDPSMRPDIAPRSGCVHANHRAASHFTYLT
jgi:hypothetical protein